MAKLGYSIYSMPISYHIREGETKLEFIKDGLKIFHTLFHNLSWSPAEELLDNMLSAHPVPHVETTDLDNTSLVGAKVGAKVGAHETRKA